MAAVTPSCVSSLRSEIQEYIRACEHLLSSSLTSDHAPLSIMEREILHYYIEELRANLLAPQCTEEA